MRKFRFKFETLERVRKGKENDALQALGRAQKAFHEAVAFRDLLSAELGAALRRRESLGQTSTPVVVFHLENEFIVGQKSRIIQAEQGILRARRAVEKALRNYLAARRETRAIELLREKALAEYKRERSKFEQKALDDLYTMRARLQPMGVA